MCKLNLSQFLQGHQGGVSINIWELLSVSISMSECVCGGVGVCIFTHGICTICKGLKWSGSCPEMWEDSEKQNLASEIHPESKWWGCPSQAAPWPMISDQSRQWVCIHEFLPCEHVGHSCSQRWLLLIPRAVPQSSVKIKNNISDARAKELLKWIWCVREVWHGKLI